MSTVLGYLVGQFGEFSGLRLAIPAAGLVVGRDPKQVHVVFAHPLVSRRHAQIVPYKDGKVYLIDLQSRNGTHVNGRRLTAPVPLSANDKIDFGGENKVVFVFETADTPSVTGVLREIFGEHVAPVDWKVGDTILDIYEVTGVLGQGGFGKVYKVHHKSWNVDLAVKSPRPELFEDEKAVENFVREAETWVNLNLHPNIVQCHYVRTIGGIPRIFAEFVPGGSLHHWIEKRKLTELDQILDVAIQFAWGLHAAHEQGLVHQDVKPLNVLMTPDGVAKVSDFGLARSRPSTSGPVETGPDNMVTMAGLFTQAYCSPEQAKCERLSRKTDIWSFGVSLLHMFVGQVTWKYGIHAPQVLHEYQRFFGPRPMLKMPKQLAKLLTRCFQVKADDRPKDMLEIAGELIQIYDHSCDKPYPRSEPRAIEHLGDGLNNRALSLLDLEREEEALVLLEQALRAEPTHIEAIYNRGLILWRKGQMTDQSLLAALSDAGKQITPAEQWRAQLALGSVHLERGDSVGAQHDLELARKAGVTITDLMQRLRRASDREHGGGCIRTFQGHEKPVSCIAISPDGRFCLSAGFDKAIRLWEVETGRCMHAFVEQRRCLGVSCVAFAPDGLRFASGDEVLRLWNVMTGERVQTFEDEDDMIAVEAVTFLPGGRNVLSGSYDRTIRLWDLATGRCLRRFNGHADRVESVAVSSDGRVLLSGSGDRTLRLWELETGSCLRVIDASLTEKTPAYSGASWLSSVAISPNGRWGLSACGDHVIRLWDLATGRCVREFKGHTVWVHSVAFFPDGQRFLSGGDTTVRVWDLATGRCVRTFEGHSGRVGSVAISPDGSLGLSGSTDTTVKSWKLPVNLARSPLILCRPQSAVEQESAAKKFAASMRQAKVAMEQFRWRDASVAIQAARKCAGFANRKEALDACSTIARHAVRKTLTGGWCAGVLEGHTNSVRSVAVTPDIRRSFSTSFDGTLRLWELDTGRCVETLKWPPIPARSHRSVFSTDAQWALLVSTDKKPLIKTIRLWNMRTDQCVRTFEREMAGLSCGEISPDCHLALLAEFGGQFGLYDLATGNWVRALKGHESSVNSIAVSADWRHCLSGSWDCTLRLWNLVTGQTLHKLEGHTGPVHSVAQSRDGRRALSGSRDKTLRIWDTTTGSCERTLEGHTDEVRCVTISLDGRWGLSGSLDKTVRLWNLTTGTCLHTFEGHTGGVNAVALSPNGRWCLSGSDDHTVRLWELDWEYEFPEPSNWDDGAKSYLEVFLASHCLVANNGLTRVGKPTWTEDDFQKLLTELQYCGYGWLKPEGVRRQLEKMVAEWNESKQ